MTTVGVHEAKTHLSRLLRLVAAGQEVLITNGGEPVARLVPAAAPAPRRTLGLDRGLVRVADDFDAPLPEAELEGWE
jgi:prevent-host-death family protein